jgi:hypothetical protein
MENKEHEVTPKYLSLTFFIGAGWAVTSFFAQFLDVPQLVAWLGVGIGILIMIFPLSARVILPRLFKTNVSWILSRYKFQILNGGVVWKKWVRGPISHDAPKGYCPKCDSRITATPGKKTVCAKGHEFIDHDAYNALKETMRSKALESWESKEGWKWAPETWELCVIAVIFLVVGSMPLTMVLRSPPVVPLPQQPLAVKKEPPRTLKKKQKPTPSKDELNAERRRKISEKLGEYQNLFMLIQLHSMGENPAPGYEDKDAYDSYDDLHIKLKEYVVRDVGQWHWNDLVTSYMSGVRCSETLSVRNKGACELSGGTIIYIGKLKDKMNNKDVVLTKL